MLDEIDKLKREYNKNCLEKSEAYTIAIGDGWHDNFAFDEAIRRERMILDQIAEAEEELKHVVVLETMGDDNIIDMGDILTIGRVIDGEPASDYTFQLVGTKGDPLNQEMPKISINSPLGECVFHKEIGYTGSYAVRDRKFEITILSKKNNKQLSIQPKNAGQSIN